MLENVEEEIFLAENLNSNGIAFIAILFAELLNEILGLLVEEGSVGLVAVGGRSHYKEAADFGGSLDHALDEFLGNGFVGEVEDGGNGGIIVLAVLHIERREDLPPVIELTSVVEVIELGEGHVLQFI